jgi:integrase
MVRWAVSEELVPATVITALETVAPLKRGRCNAREPVPIRPVPETDVNAVLRHVSRQVRDMIRLQLLTGCRPEEVCALRPCDVDRRGDVWEVLLEQHKCAHHDIERRLFLGPRAQAILTPYIDNRPADAYCFCPAEAEAERKAELRKKRKSKVQPSQLDRRKPDPTIHPGEAYTTDSYRRAIHRACKTAKITPWAPNRLRHSRLTDLRREYGIETAQAVAGHTRIETTQVYAEAAAARARAATLEVG